MTTRTMVAQVVVLTLLVEALLVSWPTAAEPVMLISSPAGARGRASSITPTTRETASRACLETYVPCKVTRIRVAWPGPSWRPQADQPGADADLPVVDDLLDPQRGRRSVPGLGDGAAERASA